MEIALFLIAAISLVTNVVLVKRATDQLKAKAEALVAVEPQEILPPAPPEIEEWQKVPEDVFEDEVVSGHGLPAPQASQQAWTNRKNIPWNDLYNKPAPQPPVKDENGPRERPKYGFV